MRKVIIMFTLAMGIATANAQENVTVEQNNGSNEQPTLTKEVYPQKEADGDLYHGLSRKLTFDRMIPPHGHVSMHRPSQATLESDLQIPGMINSYGQTFFHDFKYLSDSRRRWREPVEEIIRSGTYDRLHILTHAFWYHKADESITETVSAFIRSANAERYGQMQENITDLASIVMRDRCL